MEYDEEEIGDLEEQGQRIRGFADVAGEAGCSAGNGGSRILWSLPRCSNARAVFGPFPAEFDNLMDEFLEAHGQSQQSHEVRESSPTRPLVCAAGLEGGWPASQLCLSARWPLSAPCARHLLMCRATWHTPPPASARSAGRWSSLGWTTPMPASPFRRWEQLSGRQRLPPCQAGGSGGCSSSVVSPPKRAVPFKPVCRSGC